MAIAFDSTAGQETAITTNVYSHTTSGTNRIIFIGFFTDGTSPAVTYAGNACTLISFKARPGNTDGQYLYYQINPTVGANNVNISATGATLISAASSSYTGAKQSGVPDASTTNSVTGAVTTLTTTLTTIADNSWTVLTAIADNRGLAAGTGSTLRTATGALNLQGIFDSNAPITPAGSTSMTVTFTTGSNVATVMASFAPAVVITAAVHNLSMLGVGG